MSELPSLRACWCGSPVGFRADKGFHDCLADRSHDFRGKELWALTKGRPVPRDDHGHWAARCICGMSEEERTGHYPEHMEWCDVPTPLDTEATQ